MKSYKEVYQMVNGLQKKAAGKDTDTPQQYAKERILAFTKNKLDKEDPIGISIFPPIFKSTTASDIPALRKSQATTAAGKVATPGTDVYNLLRKALIESGQTNWYNFNNPKTPKKMPVLNPSIKDDKIRKFFERMAPAMVQNKNTKANTIA